MLHTQSSSETKSKMPSKEFHNFVNYYPSNKKKNFLEERTNAWKLMKYLPASEGHRMPFRCNVSSHLIERNAQEISKKITHTNLQVRHRTGSRTWGKYCILQDHDHFKGSPTLWVCQISFILVSETSFRTYFQNLCCVHALSVKWVRTGPASFPMLFTKTNTRHEDLKSKRNRNISVQRIFLPQSLLSGLCKNEGTFTVWWKCMAWIKQK